MENSNHDIVESNLSLIGKLFDLKYFYILLVFLLSLDIFCMLVFQESILSVDFVSIISQSNISFFIMYIISLGFLVTLLIPYIKFVIYKLVFKVFGGITLLKIKKQKEISRDYIRVDMLYREALLEKNQYKLDKVKEYHKYEKEVEKTTNIVMSVIFFCIVDILISNTKSRSFCGQILYQILLINSKLFQLLLVLPILLFFYVSIMLLVTGYEQMWNDLTVFPRNEEKNG